MLASSDRLVDLRREVVNDVGIERAHQRVKIAGVARVEVFVHGLQVRFWAHGRSPHMLVAIPVDYRVSATESRRLSGRDAPELCKIIARSKATKQSSAFRRNWFASLRSR